MSDDDRLDLTPLDPMEHPHRWDAVLHGTLRRVDAVLAERNHPEDPMIVIASWRRRLLLAAAAALAILVPTEILLEMREARLERVQRLVDVSSHWGSTPPTGADFVRALGRELP